MPPVSAPPLTLAATWPDGDRADVRLGPPFAEGGDARVHPVEGRPALVAKVYRDPAADPRRRAKLDAMLAAPPEGALSAEGGEVALSWPVALLERTAPPAGDAGGVAEAPAGFLMPRVDLAHAADLELLLARRARRAAGLPESYRFRVSVAANLAALVAALHARGHHVVDLKPSNVHVYRASGRVAVLDCDGLSVAGRGGERFPAHQYTDGYIAPEALRAKAKPEALGEAQDRFALAVLVFRLLCDGLHPFQGVPAPGADVPTTDGERVAAGLYPYGAGRSALLPPPSSLYGAFDRRTRALFDRAFDGPPGGRASAEEWRGHLRELLEGGLRPCKADADHARFPSQPCAACEPEATRRPATLRAERRPLPPTPGRRASSERLMSVPVEVAGFVVASVLLVILIVVGLSQPLSPGERSQSDADALLHSALSLGDADGAREALVQGADVSRNVGRGPWFTHGLYEPLDDAVGFPSPKADALRCAADPMVSAPPYLHWATYTHRLDLASALLESGASIDAPDRGKRTALMWASSNCGPSFALRPGAVEAIVRAGRAAAGRDPGVARGTVWSDPTQESSSGAVLDAARHLGDYGSYAAAVAGVETLVRNAAAVDLLLGWQPDVEATDLKGRTALVYAAASGNAASVRQLLDAGASPDHADVMGVTPLMVAADQAASPRSDRIAAAVVLELLAAGADPGRQDQSGRTASDYVGERESTRRGKLRRERQRRERTLANRTRALDLPHQYESLDTLQLRSSETMALLQAAEEDPTRRWSRRDPLATAGAPVAPRRRRAPADLGDGGTAVSAQTDIERKSPPWTWRELPTVECNAALAGPLRVTFVLERWGTDGAARRDFDEPLWAPAWGRLLRPSSTETVDELYGEKRRCVSRVQSLFQDWYDVSAEPERWPQGTFTVRVLPETE